MGVFGLAVCMCDTQSPVFSLGHQVQHTTPSSCMKYGWIQLFSFMNPWVGAIQNFMHEADLPKKEDCSLRSADLITSCQRPVYRSVLSFFNLMFNFSHLHTLGSGFLGLFRVF
jgi:hypothetical protein